MSISLKFLQGEDSSKLLKKTTNTETGIEEYDIPLTPGSVYFSADGKILWDYNDSQRIFMDSFQLIQEPLENIILNTTTWTDILNFTNKKDLFGNPCIGTFALQIFLNRTTSTITASRPNKAYYSGVFSVYGQSKADSAEREDEIILHRSGDYLGDIYIYARLYTDGHAAPRLQLKTNITDLTINSGYVRLRQLI